jgi:2-methylaconitate cis-trans-isomerase PrpF
MSGLNAEERHHTLTRVMGSPDAEHGRQLNGMGGGVSSLSKVVVVDPAQPGDDAHVRYHFIQVGIKDSVLDESGNCGNLSSMIGAYSLWTRLAGRRAVDVTEGEDGISRVTVRALNTNTRKVVATTFPITEVDGRLEPILDLPETLMAGVPGKASRIILDFVDPAGAATGKLLPSGSAMDVIDGPEGCSSITASLVDATNPTVFIRSEDFRSMNGSLDYSSSGDLDVLEHIRREGAKRMGLDPNAQAQPKICVLTEGGGRSDVVAHTLSMGTLHKAIPMTVGLCLGVAAKTPGTIVSELVERVRAADDQDMQGRRDLVRIEHPGGLVEVGADIEEGIAGRMRVRSAQVTRTGKRLMSGDVWV